MAKTEQQIWIELIDEKNNQPALAPLTSTSNTAVWIGLLQIFKSAVKLLYDAWDNMKAEIAIIAAQQIVGTPQWYEGLALNWTGGTAAINAANCMESLSINTRKVLLKVATKNSATQGLVNITLADLLNLKSYINSKKVVGTDIDVISQSADLLWLAFSVKYQGNLTTVQTAVKQAIKDYLGGLQFGDNLSMSLLANAIFDVPDVLDVQLDSAKLDIGFGYVLQSQNIIVADAGYWEIGKDSGNNDLLNLNMYQ
jgi:hypothetical protein